MKISLNWLQQYIDLSNFSVAEIAHLLTDLGLEEEGIDNIESIKGGLKGVIVGEVLECGKHPNADKLSLTKVTIGTAENLQIVCGAPNVAAGQKVLVATEGTEIHLPDGTSFVIKPTKMRGEVSQGMICAADELGLGTDHDGIMVLPDDVPVGTLAADYFEVAQDVIFDIGLTPNRGDANSHIGVAKDISAAMKVRNLSGDSTIKWPDAIELPTAPSPCSIEINTPELCPRYTALLIEGVQVTDSPNWLKNRLLSIGLRPINNIVDVTNFILHEYGQPIHAFDADKIPDKDIVVTTLPQGTPFNALDDETYELSAEDLMICDKNRQPLAMAGVFGGSNSGVSATTTSVIIEVAEFHPKNTRRSSFHHQLRTEAARAFELGVDVTAFKTVQARTAHLITTLAGGQVVGGIADAYPNPAKLPNIPLTFEKINTLTGINFTTEQVVSILTALDLEVMSQSATALEVKAPSNKQDVRRDVDLIEEILRVYGYNHVPEPGYVRIAIDKGVSKDQRILQEIASNYLTSNGICEAMSLSITKGAYFEELYPFPDDVLVHINNTSNINMDTMRPTMLLPLLEAVAHNQNRQLADVRLYEFGRIYERITSEEWPFSEQRQLAIILAGNESPESWTNSSTPVSFYTMKTYVQEVLNHVGIAGWREENLDDTIEYSYAVRWGRGRHTLARIGQVKDDLLSGFGIEQDVFFAEIAWDTVLQMSSNKVAYEELGKFPAVRRDFAFVVDKSIEYSQFEGLARKAFGSLFMRMNLFDVYDNEAHVGEGNKSYAISIILQDKNATLKDKVVDKASNAFVEAVQNKLNGTLRN